MDGVSWGNCLYDQGNVLTLSCLVPFYRFALGFAISLVGTVSLLMIMVAGIKYITSGGGKQVAEAQNTLTYAIIGLIIVLVAVFIVNIIGGITGVKCIFQFGFTSCQ